MEGENRELKKESQELNRRVERFEPLAKENKDLREENTVLKTAYCGALEEIDGLKSRVAEFEARINSNSGNSNKPPSSDDYQKKPAFTKKKKGKQGGQ